MATIPTIGIPPLAGIATYAEAARPGLSVDDNVERLRRYNYIERRLHEASAAFINPTPEWEVKGALSLHTYLDAEHSTAIRNRVEELRRPPLYLDVCADERLESLMNELLRARSTAELLTALFRVVRPALLAAYEAHIAETNPLFDFQTCRALKQMIAEEAQMVAWGEEALAAVIGDDAQAAADAAAWDTHLRAYLAAAGGIAGTSDVPIGLDLPAPRATEPFVPDFNPRRDARSGDIYNFNYRANDVYLDEAASVAERTAALMYKRFHEMDVPEMMASIMLQTPNKPWEYYHDMARQLWDEVRHSMMGEVWFAEHGVDWSRYPNHVGFSLYLNQDRLPIERHLILYLIEHSLMDAERGKKFEWKLAQEANDPLATYFQDYDWADEVLHANIGRRWLKPDIGGVKEMLERGKAIANLPRPTLERHAALTPQVDWWPEYIRDVTGQESTAKLEFQNTLKPKFSSVGSG